MKPKRMTLEEISQEIGISRTTIYKVINNKGFVAENTKQEILKALDKYSYTVNQNARNLAMNKEYSICFSGIKSKSAKYFSQMVLQGINQATKELRDHGLKMHIVETDIDKPQEQVKSIEALAAQGFTNFIVAPTDPETIRPVLETLIRNGCNIVLLSRDISDLACECYVGVDYYKSGMLAGELLAKMTPDNGTVQIFVTAEMETNQDIRQRYSGFIKAMEKNSGIKLLPAVTGLHAGEVQAAVEKCIKQNPNLNSIFDLTYLIDEVAHALVACEKQHQIKLIGFDLFNVIHQYIKESMVDAVIFQDIIGQAYSAVQLLFRKLCYGNPIKSKYYYSRLDIVMAGNLEYFTCDKENNNVWTRSIRQLPDLEM